MITFYKGEANRASKMILKFVSSDKTFLERAQKEKKEKEKNSSEKKEQMKKK